MPTDLHILPYVPFGSCLPHGGSAGWEEDAGEMRKWYGGEGGPEAGVHMPCMGKNGGFQVHLLQLAKMLLCRCP